MSAGTAVSLRGVLKEYQRADYSVRALDHITLDIRSGQFFCLMGPSGSGKSTLLHLVAGIDRPTDGAVEVLGSAIGEMDDRSLARWRSQNIGYIFQSFNLVPVMTAAENVELPLLLTHLSKKERRERARSALEIVGLGDRLGHRPQQLSGGQEQRVAIARAIVTDPSIILADEPTGELDAQSATDVLTILERLNSNHGKTIIMVTHDPRARQYAKESRYLDKGRITEMPEIQ
ncbi:MAG: ABC transporter ATP-binding protein [Acidobacteriia bacterium]|nr:ABC transporter ATP-binding protein [Terriglobia bacterium]MYG04222.1 ABC transporter ATP-binding protein [Terriglobia bacterium]MYK09489.1 ABC transporter ATP-binding protein [Terriglobia bacterium]